MRPAYSHAFDVGAWTGPELDSKVERVGITFCHRSVQILHFQEGVYVSGGTQGVSSERGGGGGQEQRIHYER